MAGQSEPRKSQPTSLPRRIQINGVIAPAVIMLVALIVGLLNIAAQEMEWRHDHPFHIDGK